MNMHGPPLLISSSGMRFFRLVINGEGVTPATVPLEDLADILRALREAVLHAAVDAGESKSRVFLSLTKIEEGSDTLTITESQEASVGSGRILAAIHSRDLSGIPARSRQSIRKIWSKAQRRDWTIALNNGNQPAIIDPKNEFPTPRFMRGNTTLCAEILRIGGTRPRALLKLPDGTKRTFPIVSKAVAETLSPKLYRVVSLNGEAAWAVGTWKIAEFKIMSAGEFDERRADPVAAFDRMRQIAGGRWNKIDPDEYVRDQRSDD